ncbi:MAG: T9SS type A sorting domain-containing protein [Chitinophagales bacterium]|nr:T9SS type A sorting domain-containing protein [Chitinophagales bacterium]
MKNIFFSLVFFVFMHFFGATASYAQPTISLSKTLGGAGNERIRDLIADHDGHLMALCVVDSVDRDTSCNYHGGNTDIMLVKMDADGNIIWQKCYGGSKEEDAYQIIQTADSGFIFVGISFSSDGDVTVYDSVFYFIWLVKIDSNGNIQWQQGLDGGKPYDLNQLHNGKYLLACYTLNTTDDFPVHYGGGFTQDAWIVFISSVGEIDTAVHYGGSDDDYLTEVLELPGGDLQLFGYTESNDYDLAGTTAYGNWDGWIIRTDSAGVIKWLKRWGGGSTDAIDGAVLLPDKGFLTAGSTSSNGPGAFSTNHGNSDVWVIRLDSVGYVLANFLFGGTGDEVPGGRRRIHNAGGGLFTIGARTDSFVGGDIGVHYGYTDFWFLTIDTNGVLVSSKVSGGSFYDDLYTNGMYSKNIAMEGGITGSNDFDIQDYHGGGDGWLIKIEGFTLVGEIKNNDSNVTIFPNPLHEQFIITSNLQEQLRNTWIDIYDLNGKIVLSKKLHQNVESISVHGLAAGTYPFVLRDKQQNKIATGKLIIQ